MVLGDDLREVTASDNSEVFFMVNPVHADLPSGRRGGSDDVVRLGALCADLDVKEGCFNSVEDAMICVKAIAEELGEKPTLVIRSGHGLQPVWATDPDDDLFRIRTAEDRARVQGILRRFGQLVTFCAARYGAAIDNVFDLPRMLRLPGTRNLKNPDAPVTARAEDCGGEPIAHDDLLAALERVAGPSSGADNETLTDTVSEPASWAWSSRTCRYAQAMVQGWASDRPTGSRHHWMLGQATRLVAARRSACFTEEDYKLGLSALQKRFEVLLGTGAVRDAAASEFDDAVCWATQQVARMSDAQAREQLAGHRHDTGGPILDSDEEEDDPRHGVSTQLVRLASQTHRFGVTDKGRVFAVAHDRPHLAGSLTAGRRSLSSELAYAYFQSMQRVPSAAAVKDALAVLRGHAQMGDPEELNLRVATYGADVWIDIGDTSGHAIQLNSDGWTITTEVPVLFERTELTAPMPLPSRSNAGLDELWRLTNIDERDRPVVLAWLVAALIAPTIPHPILAVFGEQGSGKSTTSRLLMDLFDPSAAPLRKAPKDIDTWVTAAAGSYGVGLDNLSRVNAELSDSLCRAVTGDGDIRRKLYTDGDLTVITFRRVILLNGIDVGAVRGDLADRMITLNLRRIPPEGRRTEDQIESDWQAYRPRILAALLDVAAEVLDALPDVVLPTPPRMADYARILKAVDEVTGLTGYESYRESAALTMQDSLQSNAFIAALIDRLDDEFCGTSKELLELVRRPESTPAKDWPRDGREVTNLLRRHGPALRASGYTVENDEARNKAKVLRWTITRSDLDLTDAKTT